jgi:hypothetical protein
MEGERKKEKNITGGGRRGMMILLLLFLQKQSLVFCFCKNKQKKPSSSSSVTGAECKRTHGFGTREPDDDVLHRVNRESIANVDVGKKHLVGFLVARCV